MHVCGAARAARTSLGLPGKRHFTSGCAGANHGAPAQLLFPGRSRAVTNLRHLPEPLQGLWGEALSPSSSPNAHVMSSTVTAGISCLKGRVESSVLCQGHREHPCGCIPGGICSAASARDSGRFRNESSVSLGKFVVSGKERELVLKPTVP